LIITPTLLCGGAEKYVSMICNNIDTATFDVSLVIVNNEAQFYSIDNAVIKLTDLATKKVRNALFAIKKIVVNEQPDIVFSTANHLSIMLAMFLWLFPRHIKFIAYEPSLVSITSKKSTIPFYQHLIKRYYKKLDHIICQSAIMQNDLIDNFNIDKDQTTVIHNPVAAFPDISFIKGALFEKTSYKFMTVARLSEEKGIDRLIKAVALLPFEFTYHIIGEGDRRKSLEELVKHLQMQDKVFFEGQKNYPFNKMEDADLFLFGSYYEGFPNAVLEAGAHGIPVVAFDAAGGLDEIIIDGENGLIVRGKDEASFALAIQQALAIDFDRKNIQERTRQRFAMRTWINKLEQLLNSLVK
jgi:glycosyltransferase involved in cell wall biosynthesis